DGQTGKPLSQNLFNTPGYGGKSPVYVGKRLKAHLYHLVLGYCCRGGNICRPQGLRQSAAVELAIGQAGNSRYPVYQRWPLKTRELAVAPFPQGRGGYVAGSAVDSRHSIATISVAET